MASFTLNTLSLGSPNSLSEKNLQILYKKKNQLLENKISSLVFDINDLEQYTRRQNLGIQGIPMSDNENNAETESKVLTVLKKIDENISHDDIDIAHRLGKSKTNKTPTSLLGLSLEEPETIFIKKEGN